MFKRLFSFLRKKPTGIDCETCGMIPDSDIPMLIHMLKSDYDKETKLLNEFPVGSPDSTENPAVREQRQQLWEWNSRIRTLHYDTGIDIENIERIMKERIPSLKDADISLCKHWSGVQ